MSHIRRFFARHNLWQDTPGKPCLCDPYIPVLTRLHLKAFARRERRKIRAEYRTTGGGDG